jgi:hypothetical protein
MIELSLLVISPLGWCRAALRGGARRSLIRLSGCAIFFTFTLSVSIGGQNLRLHEGHNLGAFRFRKGTEFDGKLVAEIFEVAHRGRGFDCLINVDQRGSVSSSVCASPAEVTGSERSGVPLTGWYNEATTMT